MKNRIKNSAVGPVLFIYFSILATVCFINAVCFDYCLQHWFNKDVHWAVDLICGVLTSAFIIPASIITWLVF